MPNEAAQSIAPHGSENRGDSYARILLVDDDDRNLDVLESILDAADYALVRARTPEEALLALLEGDFAAIVLDINLPGMTGIELAQVIKKRKRTQHVPIIFLTAYFFDDKHVLEGYSAGAVDYLTKPFNPRVLRSKVAVFVDLFRKTRALAAANQALEFEVSHRKKAEDALQCANEELETRVERRTFELTRTHQDLRVSEARFRQLADAMPQIVWTAPPGGTLDYCNRRWYELTGAQTGATGNKSFLAVVHPDDRRRLLGVWKRAVSAGAFDEIECRFRMKDGRYRWFLGRALSVHDDCGRIERWYGTCTDIHDWKLSQEALNRRTRTLELLNRFGGALVAELEPEKLAHSVVEAGSALSGATCALLYYRTSTDEREGPLLHCIRGSFPEPPDRLTIDDLVALFESGNGQNDSTQLRTIRDNGRCPAVIKFFATAGARIQSILGVPIVSRSGLLLGGLFVGSTESDAFPQETENALRAAAAQTAMAIDNASLYAALQRDLEQRKRSEAAVAAHARRAGLLSETTAKLLISGSPDDLLEGIFVGFAREVGAEIYFYHKVSKDEHGVELALDFGISSAERPTMAEREFGKSVIGTAALWRKATVLEHVQEDSSEDARRLRALGVRACACHPLNVGPHFFGMVTFASKKLDRFDADEVRFMETLADVVAASLERSRLLKEVNRARDTAEHASRAKDDFLAALSHELRTPLNPVLLLASEAAANSSLPADARQDFATIRDHVNIEARLIDDLLDLTRIARGKISLERHRLDLHDLLRDCIDTCAAGQKDKQISLNTSFEAEKAVVVGDPTRLRQVFWNLLKNSIKFTPPGGRIEVRTATGDGGRMITVFVSDSGVGMTQVELDTVFDPFTQGGHASEGTSRTFGGLGLGLAISRTLVELHNGSILASSNGRGKGAMFSVGIPLARRNVPSNPKGQRVVFRPASLQADASRQTAASAPAAARRILVLDDHGPTRKTLLHLLRRRGHDVTAAETLACARDLFDNQSFDLFISDLGLPDGDGCTLMAELRTRQPNLVGVAISGYGMIDDINRSRDAGFSQHLTKPVDIASIDRLLAALGADSGESDKPKP